MNAPRLLIIDDSRLIVQIIVDYFEPMGYSIHRAGHAEEALRGLELETPDIIVSDILMPGIDGWSLFERIRSRPEFSEIPFIFLTTERELPQKLRGFHLGADDYVTKPFEVEELYARVERSLERRRQLEKARRGDGAVLAGSVEHLSLPDLLQILSLNGRNGVVYLRSHSTEGEVHFDGGKVTHAWSGNISGQKALYRMLGWEDAEFRVMPGDGIARERSVDQQIDTVMMHGMVSLDEWNRWKVGLPETGQVLAVNAEQRDAVKTETVTEPEYEVLARARSGSSIAAILDDCPLLDGALAEAICSLLDRKILLPVDPR
ncbi:MAG: response regulator [Acidobacteria bacterium]|uniref:Response regulator n=1 Tax=Candidatus Polarisedimenticola svalbardensis TaxID=2886004 RepID=A0A8J6Y3U0_9BACT|nr:response regulator [Candidatus Polarisedimenticola svalbardensis]